MELLLGPALAPRPGPNLRDIANVRPTWQIRQCNRTSTAARRRSLHTRRCGELSHVLQSALIEALAQLIAKAVATATPQETPNE